MEIRASERPSEGSGQGLVAVLKREEVVLQGRERDEVVRREDLALDGREVDLDLVQPTRVDGRVHGRELRGVNYFCRQI